MKDKKILEVCSLYLKKLDNVDITPIEEVFKSEHVKWMLTQVPTFLLDNRKEKANRWLGFIQGALWSKNLYSIEEFKDHNKPSKES